MKKNLFDVSGMTCSACSARIERTLSKLDGIAEVSVNLLSNSMSVTFDETKLNTGIIVKTIQDIGYGAFPKNSDAAVPKKASSNRHASEIDSMRTRLFISTAFTAPLFYISMGEMLGWPMPSILSGMENSMIYAITLFILTVPVIFVNRRYFLSGFNNLFRLSPNMDSLIAIGSGSAFVYGIYALYRIAWGLGHNDMESVHKFSMDLYFESAAMILTLITLGKFLETRAKGKTSEAISKLMNLTPKTAIAIRNGLECEIPIDDVLVGDILIVKDGGSIPVDGIVVEGYAAVDESAITGESLPSEKTTGNFVTGGTIIRTGYIRMETRAVGENTSLAKIIRLVDEATSSKAPIARAADKISGVFVPIVIMIAVCSALLWYFLGYGFEFALTTSIAVLVISCPCALGLATPTAIMVGTGKGASCGILIKSAEALETLHHVNVAVFDKTGTITEGNPSVTDIIPIEADKKELLSVAAAIEKMSGHPLATAIVNEAERQNVPIRDAADYTLIPGQGITGIVDGAMVYGGNKKLMSAHGISTEEFEPLEYRLSNEGKTILYFAKKSKLLGFVAVADTIKPTSRDAVSELAGLHLDVIMLSGDSKRVADAICKQAGISTAIAEVLPVDKESNIRAIQSSGKKVVMIGDGINDAPALARADIGIAIGVGAEIAIESADIVLMKNDPRDVATAIRLSRAVMRNIKQNLFWAFIYNVIGIPVAAGAFYGLLGWQLNPMIAAAAMSLSSVSVVSNALRLRLFKPKHAPNYHINETDENNNVKELTGMEKTTKTMKIEGMSCKHCSGAVTKALNALNGVTAEVFLESKTAVVQISDASVTDSALKAAVEDAGYQVVGIE